MKEKKIDKKLIVVIAIVFLILIGGLLFLLTKSRIKSYGSYTMEVRIETVNTDDVVKNYTIKYTTDGKNSVVEASHISSPIYIKNNTLTFKDGGRFKSISSKSHYGSIYDLIKSIPLKNEISKEDNKISYNPEVSSSTVEAILKALVLGRSSQGNKNAFLTLDNGALKEFSLNIDDVEDYKTINILISFEKLEKNTKIETKNTYKELTDKVDFETLKILE